MQMEKELMMEKTKMYARDGKMNIVLEELIKKCKRISNTKKILHNDIYDEII